MADPVYIFGHKNPDADAICSAIAYEAYKHALGETRYQAARCGNSNARVDAILERFGVSLPQFIGDVTPRIESIMHRNVYSVTRNDTCAEALELIDQHDVRALPVVDEHGHVEGLLTIFELGEFFIPKPREPRVMRHVHTNIDSIIRSLKARVLHQSGGREKEHLYVRVGAMDIRSFGSYQKQEGTPPDQSIIIVGDRWDIQQRSIQMGVRLLIITGDLEVDEEVLQLAQEKDVSLIVSAFDSATTSWIVRTATLVESAYNASTTSFSPEDSVAVVKRRIAQMNDPLYPVLNDNGELVGVFSKSDILRSSAERIALVDHNELGQAVTGADEVEITEVLDHHRLDNASTEQPILFINRPVGSTCSIVADLFRQSGLAPGPEIAGVMMGGIISDTLNLNSPTTTALEPELLEWLSTIAGAEPDALADLIFSSGSVILHSPPDRVIRSDAKIYEEGPIRYSVSQIEELGFDNFWNHVNELGDALREFREEEGLYFSLLLVTDINSQDSLLLVSGDDELQKEINFTPTSYDNIFNLPGVVSRKKQLIPYVSTLLRTSGLVAEA